MIARQATPIKASPAVPGPGISPRAGVQPIGKLIDVFGFDRTLSIVAAAELLCAAQFAPGRLAT